MLPNQKRADIVFFINEIPLIVVETKATYTFRTQKDIS
ncbi:MAG TPA: hypothetical protein HPP94_10740 [Desulfuromonadales bacterium]|nr:hypothetical protein [Desulfuromonadales bacterium]